MGLFTSINIAATGMSVESLRRDIISDNIANASTTRTADGGKFKKSTLILEAIQDDLQYRNPFVPADKDSGVGKGVRALRVEKDNSQGRLVYDPTHPDAIQTGPNTGYVEYPNVNIVNEMVNLISASRAYEANATVIQGSKEMFQSALQIGK
ncbi:MAG TPA: flagellar basal body rod protein FlgC [Treponemataceae bacterium]|jgi:flagellar basal-body rod protein FlgC|nr:flagellar basal body rod protein FlgC [Treponemataceae bacterium]HOQ92199.1 flagellar basal body rod protein FlgC [Treponemataceae bacterium]